MQNILKALKRTHKNYYSFVIGAAIILYWRGIWGLFDAYFFPGNDLLSYGLSLFIGLFILWFNDKRLNEIED